jgi:hypothetical protein
MYKLSLVLLLFPLLLKAQSKEEIDSFNVNIPTNLGKVIYLPDPGRGDFEIDNIAPYDAKIRILVVTSDSLYHKIFSRFNITSDSLNHYKGDKTGWEYKWMQRWMTDSIPFIDFSKQELVLFSACAHCLAFCNHKVSNSCHRAACDFTNRWFVREKAVLNEAETRRAL